MKLRKDMAQFWDGTLKEYVDSKYVDSSQLTINSVSKFKDLMECIRSGGVVSSDDINKVRRCACRLWDPHRWL